MALQYPTPVQISSPNGIKKFRYSVSEQPDAIFDFATESGLPEEIWTKKDGLVGRWAADSRVFQANSLWVFELACWKKAWNWDGGGVGFMTALAEQTGNPAVSSGYPKDYIVVDAPTENQGDATQALQNAINQAIPFRSTILIPFGSYRISDTLFCGEDVNQKNGIRFMGEDTNGGHGRMSTRLIWDGPADRPLLWLSGDSHSIENLYFLPGPNKHLLTAVNLSRVNDGQPVTFSSRLRMTKCAIECQFQEDRTIKYGVTIGSCPELAKNWHSNLENCVFEDCSFRNCSFAGVYFYGGQPFRTQFSRCTFDGFSGAPKGRGVHVETNSFGGSFIGCEFTRLESWFAAAGAGFVVSFLSGQSEMCKNAIVTTGPFTERGAITMMDMRAVVDNASVASAGPAGLSAEETGYFLIGNGASLTLIGNLFQTSVANGAFKIKVNSTMSIDSQGNAYPNNDPWEFQPFPGENGLRHGVRSFGDKYQGVEEDIATNLPMPRL